MAEQKSPAFQMYVNDFLGSAKVGSMTVTEIGVYLMLLFLDWQEVGFPHREKSLSRWCRLSPKKFREAWEAVSPCFVEIDGRMYNPRLRLERQRQAEWREKSSKGGKVGAGKRWNHPVTTPITTPITKAIPFDNTPSPTPSPVTTTTKNPAAKAERGSNVVPIKPPLNWVGEGSDLWNRKVGPIKPARFGASLKPLVDQYGWEDARAALVAYIEINEGKARKVEWLVADGVRWVEVGKMKTTDSNGDLTERGKLLVRGPKSA